MTLPRGIAVPFQIERIALAGGVQTEIICPYTCQSLTVSNGTTGDLRLISVEDGSQYHIIASGFERIIWLPQTQGASPLFHKNDVVGWLRADDAGIVILQWA